MVVPRKTREMQRGRRAVGAVGAVSELRVVARVSYGWGMVVWMGVVVMTWRKRIEKGTLSPLRSHVG